MSLQTDFSKWEDRSHVLLDHTNKTIVKAFVGKSASVQVSFYGHILYGRIAHLWIRRHDNKPMGWTELQRTKNEIVGEDVTAIQVFPKTTDLVDQANMYHLWAFLEYEFGIDENGFKF